MDVILVNPPSNERLKATFGAQTSFLQILRCAYLDPDIVRSFPGESLGLDYLAGSLRSSGFSVGIIDACLEELDLDETVERLLKERPPVVGFTGPGQVFEESLSVARALRSQGFRGHITAGGHFASSQAYKLLRSVPELDSVCLGEGEVPLVDLATSVLDRSPLTLRNVAMRDQASPVAQPSSLSLDLDTLAWPVRDQAEMTLKKGFALSILSSRGCGYGLCLFCGTTRHWRGRRPECVVAEMESLRDRFGIRWVTFADEDFIGPSPEGPQRAATIARLLLKRGTDMEFMIDCRPDAVDRELFRCLKEAGLRRVFLGIETPVERILRIYRKGTTREQIVRAISLLRELGISFVPGYIFFDPFSSIPEMVESLDFYVTLAHYDLFRCAHRLYVDPSLPICDSLRGMLPGHESEWTRGAFPDPRVGAVHRALWEYIHRVVPLHLRQAAVPGLLSDQERAQLISNHHECFRTLLCRALSNLGELEGVVDQYYANVSSLAERVFP